jgi:hypothetical protein
LAPPPCGFETIEFEIVASPVEEMFAVLGAELRAIVELLIENAAPVTSKPPTLASLEEPPGPVAETELSTIVLRSITTFTEALFAFPIAAELPRFEVADPDPEALLPAIVLRRTFRVPPLEIPPPLAEAVPAPAAVAVAWLSIALVRSSVSVAPPLL